MDSKFQLSVCPHDTAKNLAGWYFLNTYLQRRLGCGIRFNPQDNFIVEREAVLAGGYHLVYANPYSALEFSAKAGFIPIARPVDVFDETLLVMKKGTNLTALAKPRVSTATKGLIVHALGCTLLRKIAVDPNTCEFLISGNHLKATQAVIRGDADVGIVFNETWYGMNPATREALEVISETNEGHAFHSFCISPAWAEKKSLVEQVLVSMRDDHPKGSKILEDLKFKGFEPAPADTIEKLRAIVAEAQG